MIQREEVNRLQRRLELRREQILRFREEVSRSRDDLQQPEVELEETAEKKKLSQPLDALDEREKDLVEAIDRAIHKIETGTYGLCDRCGKDVSLKRLEAVPWTSTCRECAGAGGTGEAETEEGEIRRTRELPAEFRGMSDKEIQSALIRELIRAKRVDLQELHVTVVDGVVYLEGFLPSETEREMLMEMVQDTLGLHDVVDRTSVDRLLWEKKDRQPPPRPGEKSDAEVILQGEDTDQDPFHSAKSGKPLSPPDRLEPETGEE